jgi:oligosaccharyltransferase complex subunit epsilon
MSCLLQCLATVSILTPHLAATMAGPKLAKAPAAQPHAFQHLWKAYLDQTPDRLKFIDAFLVFLMLSGIIQFLYCLLISSFPFNAFLAGSVLVLRCRFHTQCVHVCGRRFASTVGQFVLAASLRSQVNPENKTQFKDVSPERCVCNDIMMLK